LLGLRHWAGLVVDQPRPALPGCRLEGPPARDRTGAVIQAVNTFGANGLLSRSVPGTSNSFYTFDPQGNVCQRFSSTGNLLSSDEYDAYGALQSQSPNGVGDVFGYGAQYGYYTDPEDGLVLLTNRYYDPGTGRFLNRDPLGQAGGANQYGYAGNNPSSYADPLGLIAARQQAGLGGAALGAFGGPIGAGLGYLAGLALYDAVNQLGTAIGCNGGGYASNRDVANASVGFALAAATIVPGAGEAEEVEQAGKAVFYHGTDVGSARSLLGGADLEAGIAGTLNQGGDVGFYLAHERDAAWFFASRRPPSPGGYTVLRYEFTSDALAQLKAAGAESRPIPFGGRGQGFDLGHELYVPPSGFDLFNQLRAGGHILIGPG
jgi:RHS repeat-associated protein